MKDALRRCSGLGLSGWSVRVDKVLVVLLAMVFSASTLLRPFYSINHRFDTCRLLLF